MGKLIIVAIIAAGVYFFYKWIQEGGGSGGSNTNNNNSATHTTSTNNTIFDKEDLPDDCFLHSQPKAESEQSKFIMNYIYENIPNGRTIVTNNKIDGDELSKFLTKLDAYKYYDATMRNRSVYETMNKTIKYRGQNINEFDMYIYSYFLLSMFKDYRFMGFWHQTSLSNLDSIFRDKQLYSRNKVEKFNNSANMEIISHTNNEIKNNVRFYFRNSTPTNYRFEEKNPNGMVYLLFDWSLIYQNNCIITKGNAARKNTKTILSKDYIKQFCYYKDVMNFIDWDIVFSRGKMSDNPVEKDKMIDLRNTELEIPNSVSLNFLRAIYVKNSQQKQAVIEKLSMHGLGSLVYNVIIDSSKFCY